MKVEAIKTPVKVIAAGKTSVPVRKRDRNRGGGIDLEREEIEGNIEEIERERDKPQYRQRST